MKFWYFRKIINPAKVLITIGLSGELSSRWIGLSAEQPGRFSVVAANTVISGGTSTELLMYTVCKQQLEQIVSASLSNPLRILKVISL